MPRFRSTEAAGKKYFPAAQLNSGIGVYIYEDAAIQRPGGPRSSSLVSEIPPRFVGELIGEDLPFPTRQPDSACASSNPLVAADILMSWPKRVLPSATFEVLVRPP
jgi:hypothetical protein